MITQIGLKKKSNSWYFCKKKKKNEKKKKWFKILNSKDRISVLFTQVTAGYDLSKLKTEINQILSLWCQHHKIIKKLYNNLIKSLW